MIDPDLLARLERLQLVNRRRLAGGMAGEHRSPRRGSSLDFADFRDYYPGELPGQVEEIVRTVRTVTPEALRDVVVKFADIGCDEFIFVPVKPDVAQLDGLAEVVL